MEDSKYKLAAIVFTDIVGYTAIMQENEQEGWKHVKKHEETVIRLTRQFNGEVLNFYGDGSLSIFESVTDAIECSALIQKEMGIEPKIPLRIGIHLGEIIFKEGNFLGDGINIASRVQSEANPGEVCVSEAVYNTAKNKPQFIFEDIGLRELKNVKEPIRIYKTLVPVTTKPSGTFMARPSKGSLNKRKWVTLIAATAALVLIMTYLAVNWNKAPDAAGEKSSIIVMPFEDRSPGDDEEFLGFGIADEIRSSLSKVNNLDVKSMSSSMYLKDKNWSAREIGDNMKVRYILEGSLTHNSQLIRLNLSLIDANSDQLIQPIEYEGDMGEDFIRMQNKIALDVIDVIKVSLLPEDEVKLANVQTENLEAYKNLVLGKNYLVKSGSLDDLNRSEAYFRKAIEQDPNLTEAYAGLVEAIIYIAAWGYADMSNTIDKARQVINKANLLDQDSYEFNQALCTLLEFEKRFSEAEIACKKAISIDAGSEVPFFRLARIYSVTRQYEKALENARKASLINPITPIIQILKAEIHLRSNLYDKCNELLDSLMVVYPDNNELLWSKAQALVLTGKYDEAEKTLLKRSGNAENNWVLGYTYALQGKEEKARKIIDYLEDRATKRYVPPSMIACIYMGLGEMEKVYELLPKEENYWLITMPFFNQLHSDPKLESVFSFLNNQTSN